MIGIERAVAVGLASGLMLGLSPIVSDQMQAGRVIE